MAIFLVLTPPAHTDKKTDQSRDAIFIPDKFSFLAFLFPFIWLLWYRVWDVWVFYLFFVFALQSFSVILGLPGIVVFALNLLLSLLIALESGSLRARALLRKGWRLTDIISGTTQAESAYRYFARTVASVEK